MVDRTFIFYPDWLEFIDHLNSEEDKLDLYNIIVSYGCHGEYKTDNKMMENVFKSLIMPKIDIAQGNYQGKIDAGKAFGRKKSVDDDQVGMLARTGLRAKEIAKQLGISEAAVYHSDGWKNRKNL